jgi:hypothetical protein
MEIVPTSAVSFLMLPSSNRHSFIQCALWMSEKAPEVMGESFRVLMDVVRSTTPVIGELRDRGVSREVEGGVSSASLFPRGIKRGGREWGDALGAGGRSGKSQ